MPKLFLHHIDIVNDRYLRGWCINRLLPNKAVTLRIYANKQFVGEVRCKQFRKDVQKAGLHTSGNCGFEFQFREGAVTSKTILKLAVKRYPKTIVSIPAIDIQPALKDTPTIFFMHIPKTAGTSFNNHVQSWFAYDQWHIHTETYDTEKLRSLTRPGTYLAGHLPLFKIRDTFSNVANIQLYALLRDPLMQLHSHLAWIKGIGLNKEGQFFRSHPPVVQTLATKLQQHALQTPEQIAEFINQLNGFEWDFFDNIQTRYFLEYRPDRVGENDAESAMNNFKQFAAIGLTENYQAFLMKMATIYGRRMSKQTSKHNQSKVTPLFDLQSQEIREAAKPLIQFDQKIYQAIKTADNINDPSNRYPL